jgi:hypothetical protein
MDYKTGQIIITPHPELAAGMKEPLADTFDTSRGKHQEFGHAPVAIGNLSDIASFSRYEGGFNRAKDLIKKADSDRLIIPEVYEQFREVIEKAAAYEARHSKLYLYRSALLTIRQWELNPGQKQDGLKGWHRDSPDMDPDDAPLEDDIYLISDHTGSLAQARPLCDSFNRLANIVTSIKGLTVQAQPGEILFLTNNVWHTSLPVKENGVRTLVRLTFESPMRATLESLPRAERQKLGLEF